MLKNLNELLAKKGLPIKAYASIIECTEKSARNKINEITEFTLKEINRTKELFPEYTFEFIFKSDNES